MTPERLDGTFALRQINGRALPDTEAILTNPNPGSPSCAVLRTGGNLQIDGANGRFQITIDRMLSCSGEPQVPTIHSGGYSQDGTALRLFDVFPDHTDTLSGTVGASSIEIDGASSTYMFDLHR